MEWAKEREKAKEKEKDRAGRAGKKDTWQPAAQKKEKETQKVGRKENKNAGHAEWLGISSGIVRGAAPGERCPGEKTKEKTQGREKEKETKAKARDGGKERANPHGK